MKRLLGAILAAGLWTGCGGGPSGGGVFFDIDLIVATNNPDSFSVAGISTSFSGSRAYSWSCSTGQANLSIGSTLTKGSIRLQATDGAGVLVHDNTYEAVLIGGVDAFTKADGTPGTWTLTFTFTDALWDGALTVTADTSNLPDQISVGGAGGLDVSWIFQPKWTTAPVNVSVGGLTSGSVRIRLWDGVGAPVFDQTISACASYAATPSGAAGVWTVQMDFSSAIGVGAVSLGQ
jgi:hypothetical protein